MTTGRGLPIAAYLGLLVALALASAFIAVLAIVIWLPPRPPDVMRADEVTRHFQAGYDHVLVEGRAPPTDGMQWRVVAEAPPESEIAPSLYAVRDQLANNLSLEPAAVRVAASTVARNDVFVFRVRELEEMHREAEQAARSAERAAERAARQEAAQAQREALSEAQRAELEARREEIQAQIDAARDARAEALSALQEAREAGARVQVDGDRVVIEMPSEGELESHAARVRTFEFHVPDTPAPPAPPPVQWEGAAPTPAPHVIAPTPEVAGVAPAPPAPPASTVPPVPIFAPAPAGVMLISGFEIAAELPDGRWLIMQKGRNWAEIGWIGRAALIIGATLTLLSLLAVLFARRLTRPIRHFSETVQAVGVDPRSEPVREEGPRELRGAARAVNAMQARLRVLIADRTKTLAAVAHDMRTPLMRLRLAAENAAPEQRERMVKEIGEVEALVASFIAFARDDPAEEARVRLDLSALLESLATDHAEAGRNVSFEGEERLLITGQSLGLKRLFANLIENALKYGAAARITLAREDSFAIVDVADDGPGVPAEQRESVFEPFVRLNEEGRGAGLGLPAARGIARAHGGDVVIIDSERGACFRVTLPL